MSDVSKSKEIPIKGKGKEPGTKDFASKQGLPRPKTRFDKPLQRQQPDKHKGSLQAIRDHHEATRDKKVEEMTKNGDKKGSSIIIEDSDIQELLL